MSLMQKVAVNVATRVILIAILIGILALGIWWVRRDPAPVITKPTETTTNVVLPGETVTPKEVIKYVTDDKEVKRLLEENRRLKIQVTQLSETIANHKATGSGTVTTVGTARPPIVVPPAPIVDQNTIINPGDFVIRAGTEINYKDFRLDFTTDGREGRYTLTQKFEVLQASGVDAAGKPVSTTKLFEIGPGETRTEVKDLKTVNVFADNKPRKKWHVGATLQAGLGYGVNSQDTSKKGTLAVGGLQWLKRGTSPAAEDSTLSLLTPVILFGNEQAELGVLPISVNLGRIKYQPFKDLWVSPAVGWRTGTLGRLGVVVTASF